MNRSWTSRLRGSPLVSVLIIIASVVLLCAGLYVADRYADRRAERRVAAELQAHLGTPQPPQVNIEGFPFLTQVAAGSVGKVHVVGDQLGETSNAPLILAHADLVMADVVTNDWFKTMQISHTEGTARIDYSAARAAYVGHYAEVDEWEPDEEVRGTEAALRAAGREVTFYTYPGVGHWFFEDDRPGYYDAEAARLAWERTVDFLRSRIGPA